VCATHAVVRALARTEGPHRDALGGRSVLQDDTTLSRPFPGQCGRDRPILTFLQLDATVGVTLGIRPEGERLIVRRQPIECGDAIRSGPRTEDLAREVNVAPPPCLMQEPGTKAYPDQRLVVGINRFDAHRPGSIERERDRRGEVGGRATPLRTAIFVDPAELGIVKPQFRLERDHPFDLGVGGDAEPGRTVWTGSGVANDRDDAACLHRCIGHRSLAYVGDRYDHFAPCLEDNPSWCVGLGLGQVVIIVKETDPIAIG
jgi:hypothetical protein